MEIIRDILVSQRGAESSGTAPSLLHPSTPSHIRRDEMFAKENYSLNDSNTNANNHMKHLHLYVAAVGFFSPSLHI